MSRTTLAIPIATTLLMLATVSVQGQDAAAEERDGEAFEPDQAVETLSSTKVSRYTRRLYGEWRAFLSDVGLRVGANDGDLFVASGIATVPFPIEHPGFIEGRGIAYEIAYMRAKAEMVRFLGTTGTREQVVELLETAAWERGQSIDDMQPLHQGARIAQKLADLTEKQLDAQLEKLDPEYDPRSYEDRIQKEEAYRLSFQQRIFTTAAAFVAGATPLKVYEGFSAGGDNYQILVGLVWSPKLSRLAGAVGDNARPMRAEEAGPRIDEWLPATLEELIPSWGVHKLVNERGEQVLVAFGQAAPRTAAPDRRDRANESALEVASLRAEGAIRAFVGETLETKRSGDTSMVLVEYASAAEGAEIDRSFYERIRAATGEVRLKGLTRVGEWVVEHPQNEHGVAIAAVSWSPSAVDLADRVRNAIETRRDQSEAARSQEDRDDTQVDKETILQRQNVDVDAIR